MSDKGSGEQIDQPNYPNGLDAFLAAVAIGASYVGETVADPTAVKALMATAIASGAVLTYRLFKADTTPEQPPAEIQHDVFGQE